MIMRIMRMFLVMAAFVRFIVCWMFWLMRMIVIMLAHMCGSGQISLRIRQKALAEFVREPYSTFQVYDPYQNFIRKSGP